MKPSKKILGKNLRELEKEFPAEIFPKEKLPLLPREKSFSKIPLRQLNVEQLSFLIMHGLGQKVLIPLAVEILQENPLAEGEDIGYSLLGSVLSAKPSFWRENPDLGDRVEAILQKAENIATEEADTVLSIVLPQKIYDFRKNKPQPNE